MLTWGCGIVSTTPNPHQHTFRQMWLSFRITPRNYLNIVYFHICCQQGVVAGIHYWCWCFCSAPCVLLPWISSSHYILYRRIRRTLSSWATRPAAPLYLLIILLLLLSGQRAGKSSIRPSSLQLSPLHGLCVTVCVSQSPLLARYLVVHIIVYTWNVILVLVISSSGSNERWESVIGRPGRPCGSFGMTGRRRRNGDGRLINASSIICPWKMVTQE